MEKIFKKSLALVLSAALCLTALVGCLTVSAEGTAAKPTYALNAVEGKPGDTVTVTADITNVSEVCAHLIDIVFPKDLTLGKVTDSLGHTYLSYEDWEANGSNSETPYYKLLSKTDGNHIRFVEFINWPSTGDDAITTATMKLYFECTIPTGATAGTVYTLTPTVQAGEYDDTKPLMDVVLTPGKVTVTTATYVDADLKIRSAGITMANGFAINFKVRKTMETSLGYTDIYLVFKKPRYDTEGNETEIVTTTVTADLRTNDPDSTENYLYTLSGVQPQELGTEVTATIYGTKNGHVYTGATVTYSVLKFATNQIKSATAKATLKTACADMINFAGAIQRYGNYNTANPIEDKATELVGSDSWKSLATKTITRDLVNAMKSTPLTGATVRVRSAGLIFEDKVVLYFNCANMGVTTLANPENYYVHVSYEDVTGVSHDFDLKIDSNYQAKLDTLYSTELGTVVTAYMIDKESGAQVSNVVEYSIETFISRNLNDAKMGEGCQTLLKYGDSVRKYAGLD